MVLGSGLNRSEILVALGMLSTDRCRGRVQKRPWHLAGSNVRFALPPRYNAGDPAIRGTEFMACPRREITPA